MDRRLNRFLMLPCLFWLGFFIIAPFCFIAAMSVAHRTPLGLIESAFSFESYAVLFDPLYARILLLTLFFAGANALICLLLAYPLAFFLYRLPSTKRVWVLTLILVPFWTSFLVRLLAFMDVLRMKPLGLDWIYTGQGVLSAMVYNYLPCAILPLFSSMEKIDPSVIEAARDLGASKTQVAKKILWPLTQSGAATAALFVFIPSLGEFLIPELIGGSRYFLLGSFLQNQFMTARNWPLGAAAIVLLFMGTLGLLLVGQWWSSARADKKERRVEMNAEEALMAAPLAVESEASA